MELFQRFRCKHVTVAFYFSHYLIDQIMRLSLARHERLVGKFDMPGAGVARDLSAIC